MTHHAATHRLERRYVAVVVFFVLAMAITWGGQRWRIAHVTARASQQQEAVVFDALVHIEQQFDEMQQALLARGKALAEAPEVSQALRQLNLDDPEGSEALIRLFAHLDLPHQWAVEVYDAALNPIAASLVDPALPTQAPPAFLR